MRACTDVHGSRHPEGLLQNAHTTRDRATDCGPSHKIVWFSAPQPPRANHVYLTHMQPTRLTRTLAPPPPACQNPRACLHPYPRCKCPPALQGSGGLWARGPRGSWVDWSCRFCVSEDLGDIFWGLQCTLCGLHLLPAFRAHGPPVERNGGRKRQIYGGPPFCVRLCANISHKTSSLNHWSGYTPCPTPHCTPIPNATTAEPHASLYYSQSAVDPAMPT